MSESASIPPDRSGAYGRGLHLLAIATACAVFPLIFVGAGVTSKGAGMVYADWPTSAGHLVNPPQWWQGDHTRWEHGHRLIGWTVGFLAIGVAALSWRRGGTVRLLALATLLAIAVQGVLGGLRVTEISRGFAMIHGIWGQMCFCLAVSVAVVSGKTWRAGSQAVEIPAGRFLRNLCVVGLVCTTIQLVLGAAYRHFGSNTALLLHVLGAMVVTMVVGWLAMWVMGVPSGGKRPVQLGGVIAALVALQLLLGGFAFTVKVMGGAWSPLILWAVPTAHVAVGALLLATLVALTLLTFRLFSPSMQPVKERGTGSVAGV
ncbi:MAG: COX15/CtaA family protein [Planctomycetes bacterium]|nr:COX15/CtaA family protein [Planctomycetota bacterium]